MLDAREAKRGGFPSPIRVLAERAKARFRILEEPEEELAKVGERSRAAESAPEWSGLFGPTEIDEREIEGMAIPALYAEARIEDFTPQDFEALEIPELAERRSVLVCGENGSGKTHLAAALARAWGGWWVRAARAVGQLRDATKHGRYVSELRRFERPTVLVLDDVTAVSRTEFAVEALLELLDSRISAAKVTIATTYQTQEQRAAFDPSIASRLAGFERIVLVGGDRRAAR